MLLETEPIQDKPKVEYYFDINNPVVLDDLFKKMRKKGFYSETLLRIVYGSKELFLHPYDYDEFGSYVYAMKGFDKRPGDTSRCYAELFLILQNIAKTLNRPIIYKVITDDEKMKKWVQDKGQKIFSWDKIEIFNGDTVIARVTINR